MPPLLRLLPLTTCGTSEAAVNRGRSSRRGVDNPEESGIGLDAEAGKPRSVTPDTALRLARHFGHHRKFVIRFAQRVHQRVLPTSIIIFGKRPWSLGYCCSYRWPRPSINRGLL